MPYNDPDEFLEGAGGTAVSWKGAPIGTVVKGTIVAKAVTQQTELSGKPKFFDSGDPMQQLVITLQTDQRDGPDDDGQRRLFAKGGRWEVSQGSGTSMLDAIRAAIKAKSPTGKLELGATLAVQLSGKGKPTKGEPPNLFTADYAPPAVTADAAVASLI